MRGKLKKPSPALVVACIALFVALGPAASAADTVGSSDIIDGAILEQDLHDDSVGSAKVINNSLTTADLKGADVKRRISFRGGAVANGRCTNFSFAAAGARAGEVVVFSLRAAAPKGMVFYGVRVPVANRVTLKLCNLTGGPSPAISNLPVRVLTIG